LSHNSAKYIENETLAWDAVRQQKHHVAFATTKDHHRIKQMREWAAKEFASITELGWLANLFLFTALPENMGYIEPRQLFLDPVWYMPSDDENPVSLLGE
jgi:hypothetical protein